MKHIKLFEEINQNTPEVDDYVICSGEHFEGSALQPLIKDNIGKLIRIEQVKNNADLYYILYEENKYFKDDIQFWREEILYWSKEKEELEHILDAKKYNL
jgi:hypothetical protein